MFSAKQLEKFAGAKRISQESFDAAVQENIEEFEMEPEEAVQAAIEEFTAQGVDLSNIIKTVTGGNVSAHPAAVAVQALAAAHKAGDADGVAKAAGEVAATVEGASSKDAVAEVLAVLRKAGAVTELTQYVASSSAASTALSPVLRALAAVLGGGCRDLQIDFLRASGAAALQQVLASHASNAQLTAAALQAAAASALKNEDGKAALMEAGVGSSSLQVLQQHADNPEALMAACSMLCSLTNPDDDSQPSSRAFPNARALAKEGAAKQLVITLQSHSSQPSEVPTALATALKQVAANDEICQEVAAAGGVQLALDILQAGLSDAGTVRPLCSLLRQLVSSDGNKALLVESGGLELLASILGMHASNPGVLEPALGLLTNTTLRNPDAAVKALECGCLDAMLELMRVMLAASGNSNGNGKENRSNSSVQRQACMAIRNIAVRSPEVRAVLLDKGAEAVLRQIKASYPPCADASSAALRDLGLNNYQ